MVARGKEVGGLSEKGKGIRKYKLVVTDQSWGRKVHQRECRQ